MDFIGDIVRDNVDDIFQDVSEHFDLKTGDISPEQTMELFKIQCDLITLLVIWKNQNKPYES